MRSSLDEDTAPRGGRDGGGRDGGNVAKPGLENWQESVNPQDFRRGPVPAYFKISEFFRKKILDGDIPVGGRVPTESEIMEAFGVSRHTARNAIQALCVDGLVEKFPGRGTFVTERKPATPDWAISSFQSFMSQSYPGEPTLTGIEWLGFRHAEHLLPLHALWRDAQFLRIKLTRRVGGRTVSYALIDVPHGIAGQIEQEVMASLSSLPVISSIERICGVRIEKIRQSARALAATPDLAAVLEVPLNSPVLGITNAFLDEAGKPAELAQIFFRPDSYEHNFELLRGDKS